MSDYVLAEPQSLLRFLLNSLLGAGVREDVAEMVADALWNTSLRGVDTHGVRLLPHYLQGIEGGRLNPDPDMRFTATSRSTGRLDADHTLGHAAGIQAIDHAVDLARESGCGFVAVGNSSHCGAMAHFALRACEHDMIGLAFTHATSKVRTAGARTAFFGTNPICFTAPMDGEGPFCFDACPTPITSNKVNQHREDNAPLQPGCAADASGLETLDPHAAVQLLPIGDYKGFGWAMMVDILCGLLTNMGVGTEISRMFDDPMHDKRRLGQFYGAIRIDSFATPAVFKRRLADMARSIRSQPRLDEEKPVMVPGDPEKLSEELRRSSGVPVKLFDWKRFEEVAEKYGSAMPGILKGGKSEMAA